MTGVSLSSNANLGLRNLSKRLIMTFSVIIFQIISTSATVDINMAELQYLSNHLTDEECSRLSAALHTQSYRLSNKQHPPLGIDNTDDEDTCLEHLLHWNSNLGEGKEKTQEELAHRLIQIGRPDLANWLTTTVFKSLASDLLDALHSMLERSESDGVKSATVKPSDVEVPMERIPWRIHDTLLVTSCCSVLLYLIVITCKALRKAYKYKKWARNKANSKPTCPE